MVAPVLDAEDRAENGKDTDNCPCRAHISVKGRGLLGSSAFRNEAGRSQSKGKVSEKSCRNWEGRGWGLIKIQSPAGERVPGVRIQRIGVNLKLKTFL